MPTHKICPSCNNNFYSDYNWCWSCLKISRDKSIKEEEAKKSPRCEVCGFSLVDSTQGKCNCGKYSW